MEIKTVNIKDLKFSEYNPRTLTEKEFKDLKKSLEEFGFVEPVVVNSAPERRNIVIGGHQRIIVAKDMGTKQIPVHYVKISDINREQELNLRLNKNLGHWDYDLLANFDEDLLENVGFEKGELDEIFGLDIDEDYNVDEELEKILREGAKRVKDGGLWQLGDHKLIIGDCIHKDVWEKLLGKERFDFMFTDPPYKIAYTQRGRKVKTKDGMKIKKDKTYLSTGKTDSKGRFKGWVKTKDGFGYRQQRNYLGLEARGGVPEYDEWLSIANDFQNPIGVNVMVFENWRNTIELWQAIEKYWKMRNMVIWWLPNRHQGFSRPYRFFNKYDIAPLATKGDPATNDEYEEQFEGFLQAKGSKLLEQYSVSIYGNNGDSEWFGPGWSKAEKEEKGYYQKIKGTRWAKVSDHVTWSAEQTGKNRVENIIFGKKPVQVLVPYIKILSPRNGIVQDPFCGSGSMIIGCEIMKRRCRAIEIEPIYGEVILARWEKFTGRKAEKVAQMAQVSQG